ncbi:MAG TPA: hypothetical protein V6D03_07810 [Candidatus Caenarcaniphilales bacterium]
MAWILNGLTVGIRIEMAQPNIQSNGLAGWLSLFNSLNIKAELHIMPVSSANNPHTLNLLQLIEVQVTGDPHLKASRLKTVSESDRQAYLPTASILWFCTPQNRVFGAS